MLKNRYFEFLYEKGFSDDKHKSLALYLHQIPYECHLEMDEGRKYDGYVMRTIFDKDKHSTSFYSPLDGGACTMLEFFVGFAYRLVRDMYGDELITVETLVEEMLTSLDIFISDDEWSEDCEKDVDDKIADWVYGEYNNHGEGNIFRFKKAKAGLRRVHMWMQASWWYGEEYLD